MGRPPRTERRDPSAPRERVLSVVKATSAAVVAVLAVGLWSLNAKLSRLGPEEERPQPALVVHAENPLPPLPVPAYRPDCNIEEYIFLVLAPAAP